MDEASQVLARGASTDVLRSYRALADHGGIPHTTLHHRARGRRSIVEMAQSQQYLTPSEEKAVVDCLLHVAELGQPVRIKHVPRIAFQATQWRPAPERPSKPPGKNWAKAFEKRHSALKSRKVRALDWTRHDSSMIRSHTSLR